MNSAFFTDLEEFIVSTTSGSRPVQAAEILAKIGSPTTSIAILEDGRISSHSISLLGDDTETLFQACSISKPVAGLAVMKLIDLGYFTLDDKICDLLPLHIVKFLTRNPTTQPLVQTITVKHLMSHTSGLSVHGFPGYPDPDKVPDTTKVLTGEYPVNTQPVELVSLPGLDFMYSGGGITVLQCLVEHIMKTPFDQIMKTYVFEPLDMKRSCYKPDAEEINVSKAFYTGSTPCTHNWHIQPELAAAGLWTTPTDLLKVVKAIQESLNEDKPGTFLKHHTTQKLLTRVAGTMALSWFVDAAAFGHAGSNDPGYRSFVFGYADLPMNITKPNKPSSIHSNGETSQPCGIAVMTNSAAGNDVIGKVVHAITYLKKWPPALDVWGTLPSFIPFPARVSPVADETWKTWAGKSWGDKWCIAGDGAGNPVAGINGQSAMLRLIPAALPPKQLDDGRQTLDFMVDSLKIMLRFSWDQSEPVIEVWNGGTGEKETFRRGEKR